MTKLKKIHHATCPTVRIAGRGIGIGIGIGTSRFGCFASQDPSYTGRVRDFFVRIDPSDPSVRLRRVRSGSGSGVRGHVRVDIFYRARAPRAESERSSVRALERRSIWREKAFGHSVGAPLARVWRPSARALVRPSVRARLASFREDEEGDENIFPLRLPETTRGRASDTGASTATGRNGTERSGRRASTRGRKGTESAVVVVVRRSIHPSVRPATPTPTSTGDAADADADDGRWDDGRDRRRRREPRGRVGADDADADDGATTGTTTGAGWQRRMKRRFLLSL